MVNAFDPRVLATDLAEVRKVFTTFFEARKQPDWERRTEKFNQGWTLRETVAHLDAVAQAYQHAIICTLAGKPAPFPGITKRTDLPGWNRIQIDERASIPISTICDSFLNTLRQAEELAAQSEPASLSQETYVPFYHRPITLGELLGGQAAHPGMVHGAQVANGAGVTPLWVHFSSDMLSRQITRFFHLMSMAYWPERGGSLRAVVAVSAAGPGGGHWYVTIAPEGSKAGEGKYSRPTLKIWFRDANSLCSALTLQISPLKALLTAQTFARGDLRLGFQMEWLFNPA